MPLLTEATDQAAWPSRPLFWYYPHYTPRPGAVVREDDLKLIVHYDPPGVELYNLANDLGERTDLSRSLPRRTDQMQSRLETWLEQVDAVLHTANPDFPLLRDR